LALYRVGSFTSQSCRLSVHVVGAKNHGFSDWCVSLKVNGYLSEGLIMRAARATVVRAQGKASAEDWKNPWVDRGGGEPPGTHDPRLLALTWSFRFQDQLAQHRRATTVTRSPRASRTTGATSCRKSSTSPRTPCCDSGPAPKG
jgi:hypothetical protein